MDDADSGCPAYYSGGHLGPGLYTCRYLVLGRGTAGPGNCMHVLTACSRDAVSIETAVSDIDCGDFVL